MPKQKTEAKLKILDITPADLENIDWLRDCEICNIGLIKSVDALVESGMSERAACEQLADDCGGLHVSGVLRSRYKYYKNRRYQKTDRPAESDELNEWIEGVDRNFPKISQGTRHLMKTALTLFFRASGDVSNGSWLRFFRADMLAMNALNAEQGRPPLFNISGSPDEQAAIDLLWNDHNTTDPVESDGLWYADPENRTMAKKYFTVLCKQAKTPGEFQNTVDQAAAYGITLDV